MLLGIILNSSCSKDETSSMKDPVITWENPADMEEGTNLSEIQLNAKADVPGIFVYTPPIGTTLNVGANQDLHVVFTPANYTKYNSVSKTVKINVTHATFASVTDIDGNVYHTVTIGTQTWMVENLKTTKYNDGNIILNLTNAQAWNPVNTTPAYCWYDNDQTNNSPYGALYNWYAVNTGKLCPAGWHVPSDEEWATLEIYLQNNGYNYDGTTDSDNNRETNNKIAKSMATTTYWISSPTTGAVGNIDYPEKRNASDFTALPGGYVDDGFVEIGFGAYWWSSTDFSIITAYRRTLYFDFSSIHRDDYNKWTGYSVRCVKD